MSMIKDYIKLSYNELRGMALNGEIEHEHMSVSDYERLLNKESEFAAPNDAVLQFCFDGLKRIKQNSEYKDRDDIEIYGEAVAGQIEKGNELCARADELRDMIFNGTLEHEQMTQYAYEVVLDNESKLANPNITVLEFCIDGLKNYGVYSEFEELQILGGSIVNNIAYAKVSENDCNTKDYRDSVTHELLCEALLNGQLDNKTIDKMGQPIYQFLLDYESKLDNPNSTVIRLCNAKLKKIPKNLKGGFKLDKQKAIVALVAVISVFIIFVAFSYTDFLKTIFNNGNEIISADGTRFYNSMSEMLEMENLSILYPNGYDFTDFRVTDIGTSLEIWAYVSEPYISFLVEVGTNQIAPDVYSHETNGVKYNILEIDSLFRACWFNESDYYSITVSDKSILSEIIENVTEGWK